MALVLSCDNAKCKHRIFTERLPGVAAPWARETARLPELLTAMGLALGSVAGASLSCPKSPKASLCFQHISWFQDL